MLSRGLSLVHGARVCPGTEQFVGRSHENFVPKLTFKIPISSSPDDIGIHVEEQHEGDDKHFNWISRAINYFREISFTWPDDDNFQLLMTTHKQTPQLARA